MNTADTQTRITLTIFKKLGMKAEEADIYKTGYNQNADHNLAPFQFK